MGHEGMKERRPEARVSSLGSDRLLSSWRPGGLAARRF